MHSHIAALDKKLSVCRDRLAKTDYRPNQPGDIMDLFTLAIAILERQSSVTKVIVAVQPTKPSLHIIHIFYGQYVPMPVFADCLTDLVGCDIPARDLHLRYKAILLEVELVQNEQTGDWRIFAKLHKLGK